MLVAKIDTTRLDYDIHSLIKAFYPEETVKVVSPDTDPEKAASLEEEAVFDIILQDDKPMLTIRDAGKGLKHEFYPTDKQTVMKADGSLDKNNIKAFVYQTL